MLSVQLICSPRFDGRVCQWCLWGLDWAFLRGMHCAVCEKWANSLEPLGMKGGWSQVLVASTRPDRLYKRHICPHQWLFAFRDLTLSYSEPRAFLGFLVLLTGDVSDFCWIPALPSPFLFCQYSCPSLNNSAGLREIDKDFSGQCWLIYLTPTQQLTSRPWETYTVLTAK